MKFVCNSKRGGGVLGSQARIFSKLFGFGAFLMPGIYSVSFKINISVAAITPTYPFALFLPLSNVSQIVMYTE